MRDVRQAVCPVAGDRQDKSLLLFNAMPAQGLSETEAGCCEAEQAWQISQGDCRFPKFGREDGSRMDQDCKGEIDGPQTAWERRRIDLSRALTVDGVQRTAWAMPPTVGDGDRRSLAIRSKEFKTSSLPRSKMLEGAVAEPTKVRLSTFLERWLEDAARPTVRATTHDSYRGVIDNHITPRIGGVMLTKLSPIHVQALYADMERDGKSPRLRQLTHAVLRRALKQAAPVGARDTKRVRCRRSATCGENRDSGSVG